MRETNGFVFFPYVKDTLGLSANEYVLLSQITFLQNVNPVGYCTYLGKHVTRPKQKFIEFLSGLVQREVLSENGDVIQKPFTAMGMRKMLKRLEARGFLTVDLEKCQVQTTAKFTDLATAIKSKQQETVKKETQQQQTEHKINIEEVYHTARIYWKKIKTPDEHMTFEQFDEYQKILFDAVFKIRQHKAMTKEFAAAIKNFEIKRTKGIWIWFEEIKGSVQQRG